MKLSAYFESERGAQARLAKDASIHASLLSAWASGDRPVPINRCLPIERATDGRVTRQDLRPDDWHEYWPELSPLPPAPPIDAVAKVGG